MDTTSQIMIVILGVGAVWFANAPRADRRRWAPVLGLLAQPAWAMTFILNQQFPMLVLCVLYGACWYRGLRHQWRLPWTNQTAAATSPASSTRGSPT